MLELGWVFRADVGGLAEEVLGVFDTADFAVYGFATEAGIDDDGADDKTGGLQELMTAVGHIHHILYGRDIFRVFAQMKEFAQREMLGEACFI